VGVLKLAFRLPEFLTWVLERVVDVTFNAAAAHWSGIT